ncbi:hypothetical protein JCM10212_002663 [Sporobolomyces blumeae]
MSMTEPSATCGQSRGHELTRDAEHSPRPPSSDTDEIFAGKTARPSHTPFDKVPVDLLRLVMDHVAPDDTPGDPDRASPESLKAASLVCKSWQNPAQRRLYAHPINVFDTLALRGLRAVFTAHPDVGRCVRTLRFREGWRVEGEAVSEYSREAVKLLRLTPNVSQFRFDHVRLLDVCLNSFATELRRFQPVNFVVRGRGRDFERQIRGSPEVKALATILGAWSSLRDLTISDIVFKEEHFSARPPTYRLERLSFTNVDLPGDTLVTIVGREPAIATLELVGGSASPDVLSRTLENLAPSLASLLFDSSCDDGEVIASGTTDPCILGPLRCLRHLTLGCDVEFTRPVFDIVFALPSIETFKIVACARYSVEALERAVATMSPSLKSIDIGMYRPEGSQGGDDDDEPEDATQRLEALVEACESRGVSLFVDSEPLWA